MLSWAFVYLFVCLFVFCKQDYAKKLLSRFSENPMKRWRMGQRLDFGGNRVLNWDPGFFSAVMEMLKPPYRGFDNSPKMRNKNNNKN